MAQTWPLVPAPGQVSLGCPGATLLLLALWVALPPAGCFPGRPSWRYVSSEVVVPRKELRRGQGVPVPGWLSYSLRFGGQRHVIRMRPKTLFVPGPLLLLTQDDQGSLQSDYPFMPTDCYYLGYLEETPLSMVTLDTCYGGLHGILKLDDLTYEIKPLKGSRRFEHVVSRLEADAQAAEEPEPEEPEPPGHEGGARRLPPQLWAAHRARVRGLFMSSFSTYSLFRNVTECARFLVRVGSLVDSFLRGLELRLHVYVLLVFNARDPAPLDAHRPAGSAMLAYFRSHLYPELLPDAGFVVVSGGPLARSYAPRPRAICHDDSLVVLGLGDRHFFLLSVAATQQLGRALGLGYDGPECACGRRSSCLMHRRPAMADSFSNCSSARAGSLFSASHGRCLFGGVRAYPNGSLTRGRCGDRAVGRREDCDCGSLKECALDACCSADCRLSPGAQCHRGACCQRCQLAPAGTPCRPARSACDLPEYCLGTQHVCPDDTYVQDGTPCSEDSYCFGGNCTDRDLQCQQIFGRPARNGAGCYAVNALGDRFGHCGRDPEDLVPRRCDWADVQCGRLQCTNVSRVPRLQEHVGFHQSLVEGAAGTALCFGLDEHRAAAAADLGRVRDGAPCGPGRFCLNSRCEGAITELTYDCTPEKCNRRGVCNNHKSCHCRAGWQPPRCAAPGYGGSQEAGQPRFRKVLVIPNRARLVELRIIFCRVYMFIASLLLGVASNTKTVLAAEAADGHGKKEEAKAEGAEAKAKA